LAIVSSRDPTIQCFHVSLPGVGTPLRQVEPRGRSKAAAAALPEFFWEQHNESPNVCILRSVGDDGDVVWVEVLTELKKSLHVRILDTVCAEEGIFHRAGTVTQTVPADRVLPIEVRAVTADEWIEIVDWECVKCNLNSLYEKEHWAELVAEDKVDDDPASDSDSDVAAA